MTVSCCPCGSMPDELQSGGVPIQRQHADEASPAGLVEHIGTGVAMEAAVANCEGEWPISCCRSPHAVMLAELMLGFLLS
mmetsp:Transcript_12495/g.27861  ORF Transcript_12495/g.27861 Transcript_12495/m.27861 type:complete len:80 (+) Transcript_12495:1551-1790(+)